MIAGNVEKSLAEDQDNCGCNFKADSECDTLSKVWYNYIDSNISVSSRQWLRTLPSHMLVKLKITDIENNSLDKELKILMVHGSFNDTSKYIFEHTNVSVKLKVFEDTGADIVVGGHSGLPFVQELTNSRDKKLLWVNTGALGMPANNGNQSVSFATATPSISDGGDIDLKFNINSLQYNNELASRKILENNLPEEYANTLISGYWNNEDILALG